MIDIESADPIELEAARRYCRDALPRVSRTFALNIRVLRGDLREAVRSAYLFCRIADTIEDSTSFDTSRRTRLLEAYRSLFPLREGWRDCSRAWAAEFTALAPAGADLALCAGAHHVFAAFSALAPALRAPVEDCVREMTAGMASFAMRRSSAVDGRLRLETLDELELYCHYVAGTVGTMLCRLFAVVSPALDAGRAAGMQRLAERFGLAMQLTNIIKDVADDADRGVFYVPRTLAARHRLEPEDLVDPAHRASALAVLRDLAAVAARALDAAIAFTLLIPRREARLRLFCLWPIFLAAGTLRRVLADERVLVPGARVRIGRAAVRRCLGASTAVVWTDRGIRWLYARERPRALELAAS